MSSRPKVSILEEELYIGHLPGLCSYLPDRLSNLLFLDGSKVAHKYEKLMAEGYRRHGENIYRPDCPACNECRVLRLAVDSFQPSRSQRRILRRGSRLFRFELAEPEFTPERAELYERYLAYQHSSAENDSQTDSQGDELTYQSFFVQTLAGLKTMELRLYYGDQLAGIGILDRTADALSSVYFYFEPEFARYSPGTYSVLLEIDLARRFGLRYYYMGYYIGDCAAMNYKRNFRPCQIRTVGASDWDDII